MTSRERQGENIFFEWLPLALITTFLCFIVFGSAQQILRQSAYDPQIQVAEDISIALAHNVPADKILPPNFIIDIASSLNTFVIIYDSQGSAVSGSGKLDGKIPELPAGVLDYTKKHQEDRLIWQPKKGVHTAVVVRSYTGNSSGYVLAGRSLREVENRTQQLMFKIGTGWLFTLAALLGLLFILRKAE